MLQIIALICSSFGLGIMCCEVSDKNRIGTGAVLFIVLLFLLIIFNAALLYSML